MRVKRFEPAVGPEFLFNYLFVHFFFFGTAMM